ncbi:MAG: dienelactone hydrolase, partial [Pseudomonadota bacterium]
MWDVGYQTGQLEDNTRPAWDLSGPRPLAWSAWYPADPTPDCSTVRNPVFDLGEIWSEAPLAKGDAFPVVLLSHGTGGSPES